MENKEERDEEMAFGLQRIKAYERTLKTRNR